MLDNLHRPKTWGRARPTRWWMFLASIVCLFFTTGGCGDAPDTSAFPSASERDADLGSADVVAEDGSMDERDSGDPSTSDVAVTPVDTLVPQDLADGTADLDTDTGCDLPCENDGICNRVTDACDCPPEYTGPLCESLASPCGDGCQHGGICTVGSSDQAYCACPDGWTGASCETPECGAQCSNGGTCVGPNQCACPEDWIGDKCTYPAPTFSRIDNNRLRRFSGGSPSTELGRNKDYETKVTIDVTRGFAIMTHEMTQGQWGTLLNKGVPDGQGLEDEDAPVANLTWWSALAVANSLSVAHGLAPCYDLVSIRDCNGAPDTYWKGQMTCGPLTSPVVLAAGGEVLDCEGYRLPTEAEWELAARAGSDGALYNTDGLSGRQLEGTVLSCAEDSQRYLDTIGWWCGNAREVVHTAGEKIPNIFGLYDVLGNLSEWTWDCFDMTIPGGVDPHRDDSRAWLDTAQRSRPIARTTRGGAFSSRPPGDVRLAARVPVEANTRSPSIGLRLVRTLEPGAR